MSDVSARLEAVEFLLEVIWGNSLGGRSPEDAEANVASIIAAYLDQPGATAEGEEALRAFGRRAMNRSSAFRDPA